MQGACSRRADRCQGADRWHSSRLVHERAPARYSARPSLASAPLLRLLPALLRTAWAVLLCARALARLPRGPDGLPTPDDGASVLSEACRAVVRAHALEVRVGGPLPPAPSMLVGNHLSWLDALVLLSLRPALPVSKQEVRAWPVVGALMAKAGVPFIDRTSLMAGALTVRALVRTLRAGASALNFPEGTTTTGVQPDGRATLEFRTGAFAAARLAKAPVVPFALRYTPGWFAWTNEPFGAHYRRVAAWRGAVVEVQFGAPLASAEDDAASARAAREAVERMLLR
jgi:1-acyl-sn-glycerol-3-phosphate acyltransferase